ncbi:MAG TPA: ribonuclease D [Thermoanaerobaculia bacterium]|nr:ribonuclease D [Thermoanaerobaculia bacterium]
MAEEESVQPHRPRLPRLPVTEIASDAALAAAVRGWEGASALALDTEFVRERTFFPRLGLIQAADDRTAYLVDPLALSTLAPFAAVLTAPGTLKVLHSASEDLEVFTRSLGAVPTPLFDTQIAATLAGVGASLGYQKLVAAVLGVELGKGETRTDWLARPLSAAQTAYAAEDVAYLLPVYERLRADLLARGRLAWALEDSAALLTGLTRLDEDPGAAYLRIRGAGRLDRRQLGVLQTLAAWRDQEARRRDLPRSFVLREDLLLALATRRPKTAGELKRLPSFDARQAARDSATWLSLIEEALARPESALPPPLERLPFTPAVRQLEDRLRQLVAERATALEIPPEVLASRRNLGSLLRSALVDPEPRLPRELSGWRREVIGETLLAAVRTAAPDLPQNKSAARP